MAKKLVLPRVHAIVLCDRIEDVSDEEDVFNLRGVRTRLVADAFPYTHPRLYVYLQLTGHLGSASGAVVVVHARTDQELARQVLPPIQFRGPLVLLPVYLRIRNCTFPEAGIYFIQTLFDDKLLGERFFELIEREG